MSYLDYYHETLDQFDARLETLFIAQSKAEQLIDEGMNYSLRAGGKRIRPMLLLEFCYAYSGSLEAAYPFALAIEMIHTYSLIHDDLPSMDDDQLRRGKPTNHMVFGEDMAILAGDGLLNSAAELMTQSALDAADSKRALRAMQVILNASGTRGMILGQVADIKLQSEDMTLETLDYINAYKTGKLLTASMHAGAILGGADDDACHLIQDIGYDMGLLFQIVDDLLDVTGSVEKLGKAVNIDSRNAKNTYPLQLGIEETKLRIEALRNKLMNKIEALSIDTAFLKETIDFLSAREY